MDGLERSDVVSRVTRAKRLRMRRKAILTERVLEDWLPVCLVEQLDEPAHPVLPLHLDHFSDRLSWQTSTPRQLELDDAVTMNEDREALVYASLVRG